MILSYLPASALLAKIKTFNILLNNGCKNPENIIRFKEECINELYKKYDLYQKK